MNNRTDSFKQQGRRRQLVKSLSNGKIRDPRVLEAIGSVPRHLFISKDFEDRAYEDVALPIEEEQTISQPYTVAFQTEALQIKPDDRVLEIGTGSGYQAAILAAMGAEVYSVERIPELYQKASAILDRLYPGINLRLGDGTKGWQEFAPYDKIIVTAGAPSIPPSLLDQLKPGGMAIIPAGSRENQKMVLVIKDPDGEVHKKEMGDFRFVPLIGDEGWR